MPDLSPVARTALGAAVQRAAHILLDGEPKIFVDSLAQRLLGVSDEDIARFRAQFRVPTTSWVVRSRYTEDRLAEAVARGVEQYVILGAGLDTFAYRAAGPLAAVRVFEVDTPESQAWKRKRLEKAGIAVPPTCVFVPCDFETQTLDDAFAGAGLDRSRPTFVSWLAVTQYLERPAIETTLRWVAGLGPGTELVLTHVPPEGRDTPGVRYAEESGARFVSMLSEAEMDGLLRAADFDETRPFGADDVRETFLTGRTDGLELRVPEAIMWARVR